MQDPRPAGKDGKEPWMFGPEKKHYDEVVTSDGSVRSCYEKAISIFEKVPEDRVKEFEAFSLKEFSGDNRLYHLPRMLSKDEHKTLMEGVEQRAIALRSFILDYFGEKTNIASVIPTPVLHDILNRSGEGKGVHAPLRKMFPTSEWGVWYGPDIIRGPGGDFFVCEDNLGYVGGMGDLICARETLLKGFPELSEAIETVPRPIAFYETVISKYKSYLKPGECAVLVHYPKRMTADNEELRLIRLFRKYGINNVPIPTGGNIRRNRPRRAKQLRVEPGGVFFTLKGKKTRVGLVIVDAEPFDIDPRSKIVKTKAILEEAQEWVEFYTDLLEEAVYQDEVEEGEKPTKGRRRKLIVGSYRYEKIQESRDKLESLLESKKPNKNARLARFLRRNYRANLREVLDQGFGGLFSAYERGLVTVVNGPGFEFIGDKLFCTFMDDVIRQYTGQEPILKTIPTKSFAHLDTQEGQVYHSSNRPKAPRKSLAERRAERNEWRKLSPSEKRKRRQKARKERWEARRECRDARRRKRAAAPNEKLINAVFGDPEVQQFVVVKRVDGRGGDSVWVGPKIPREEFAAVREKVEKEPEAFIVQQYIALSQVNGQLVDLRGLCNVGAQGVVVSHTLWGRGVAADGSNGKVNISDKGFEFAICVAKE